MNRRGRGREKAIAQWEKLLMVMLDGHVVTVEEITTLLKDELVWNRFSTYLWNIQVRIGGEIKRHKVGRKIVSYQLMNPVEMKAYAIERGLIDAPTVPLAPQDLMVGVGG